MPALRSKADADASHGAQAKALESMGVLQS